MDNGGGRDLEEDLLSISYRRLLVGDAIVGLGYRRWDTAVGKLDLKNLRHQVKSVALTKKLCYGFLLSCNVYATNFYSTYKISNIS